MPVRITPAGAPALRCPRSSLDRIIDEELDSVRRTVLGTTYPQDPILGSMSRTSSMAAALVRRHGFLAATILTRAIDILSDGRVDVLPEYCVPLTKAAADLFQANARTRIAEVDLPADGAWSRTTYRADCVIVSEDLGVAWIVEVKRRHTPYGRRMRRPMRQLEMARLSAAPLLRGAYRISQVETVLISLYGDAPSDDVLDRKSLDAFFGLELETVLDRLDLRYAKMAAEILGERVRSDLDLVDPARTDQSPVSPILAFRDGEPATVPHDLAQRRPETRRRPADILCEGAHNGPSQQPIAGGLGR